MQKQRCRSADQYLYFCYTNNTTLLLTAQCVCVRPGRKSQRPFFSCRGSIDALLEQGTHYFITLLIFVLILRYYLSCPLGKPTICIGENKDADQLRGNRDREADQRLCFRYSDSTIPLLLKSEISSFYLFSVLVQAGLCRTCSETTLLVFPRGGSFVITIKPLPLLF